MSSQGGLGKAILLMVLIVIGLALTPTVGDQTVYSKYWYAQDEAHDVVPATANTTTVNYGPVWNRTGYITVLYNGTNEIPATGAVNYTVTAATTFTFGGLTKGSVYNMTISYSYLTGDAIVIALVDLAPMFWAMFIIAIPAVAVYLKYRGL